MSLIDDIKRDRDAGTPGPWAYEAHGDTMQYGVGVCHDISDIEMAFPLSGEVTSDVMVTDPVCVDVNGQANARRIARVPDMEAALIAAEELVKALSVYSDPCEATETNSCGFEGNMCCMTARTALAAYRKAT